MSFIYFENTENLKTEFVDYLKNVFFKIDKNFKN